MAKMVLGHFKGLNVLFKNQIKYCKICLKQPLKKKIKIGTDYRLIGKSELVALLCLSSWCLVIVLWLFLAVPWVCLQFVFVVFPDHTHYF